MNHLIGRLFTGLVVVILLGLRTPASAETPYYAGKEEGWFWKEIIPEPQPPPELARTVPETKEAPDTAVAPPQRGTEAPEPLSPAWLRERLPEYRDRAIQSPSSENVRAYYYLQRYAMDIAERFAQVAQQVVLADPSLDENSRRPISSYGGQVFDSVAREETERVARQVAAEAGVWYFFASDCPYCRAQNPILARLQQRIGLTILPISIDGKAMPEGPFRSFVPDRGHARQLGVTQTPTLYLVRDPKQFVLVSEGLVTDDELLERIVLAAHDAGWVSEEDFNATRPRRPSSLSAEPLTASVDLTDPHQLIEWLRTHDRGTASADPQAIGTFRDTTYE
jgi:conjugal transfer pilus assembly protein TraF